MRAHTPTLATCTVTQKKQRKKIHFSPKKYMQHPSGAAGSYSRSPPACPSSMCPACCGMCSRAYCGAWPLLLELVPSQGTHQPHGQGCWSLPCCPVRMTPMLMCGKGGAGGGEGRTPSMVLWEHRCLWVVFREDLAQLESQIEVEGMVLA